MTSSRGVLRAQGLRRRIGCVPLCWLLLLPMIEGCLRLHELDDRRAADAGGSADTKAPPPGDGAGSRTTDSQADARFGVPPNSRLIHGGSEIVAGNALISPDGAYVLYQLAGDPWRWQVYDVRSGVARAIHFDQPSPDARVSFHEFTTDGKYAALWSVTRIGSAGIGSSYIVDLDQALARTMPADCSILPPSDVFTPDSSDALCRDPASSEVKRMHLADGAIATVVKLPSLTSSIRYRAALHGGRRYLLATYRSGQFVDQLTVVDLDTTQIVLEVTGLPNNVDALGPTPAGWIVIQWGSRTVRLDAGAAAYEDLPQLGDFDVAILQPERERLLGRSGGSSTPVWREVAVDGSRSEERPLLTGLAELRWIGGTEQLLGHSLTGIPCSDARADCSVYRADLARGMRTTVGLPPITSLNLVAASAERTLLCQGYGPNGDCSGASLGDLVLVNGDQRTLLAQDVTLGTTGGAPRTLGLMADRALTRGLAHVRYLDQAHGGVPGPANGLYLLTF